MLRIRQQHLLRSNQAALRRHGRQTEEVPPAGSRVNSIVERIDELLEMRYRSADLGNVTDPLAESIYILISQQTRDEVYRRVFRELRERFPRWCDVLHADPAALEGVIRPAGF